jgi:glycosyltransferase involved in cell wall biosynthesis
MKRPLQLFIGIATWNSARFLEPCLSQIEATCTGMQYQIGVLDNGSTDGTVALAKSRGCKVEVRETSFPDALNRLASWSRAPFTLFMHSDTMLLNPDWFRICTAKLVGCNALISPQDIGCGPFTRPWGKGMPESSFMLFRTADLLRMRNIRWVRRFRIRWPQRIVNFYSQHATHFLPAELERRGLSWTPMKVHTSRHVAEPLYIPADGVKCWAPELAHLEYGLGNFYSIDGVFTHYHNWYERLLDNEHSARQPDQSGIPLDYVGQRSQHFLDDLRSGRVTLPDISAPEREPAAIAVAP